ncbi:MAG: hypothetical protein IKY04_07590, partial [Lachnospiraceae bacterium]|nr:hypothetical protein [Lachnospiraceae bacterium]
TLNGKKRYVDCLCSGDGNKDKCPFCKARMWSQVKFFIPVYDEDNDAVYTWERGKTYGPKLRELFEKHAKEEPLSATSFTVTREINAEGYAYYTIEPEFTDGATVEEFPDFNRNVYGKLILLKTAEEMECYLKYGDFYDKGLAS